MKLDRLLFARDGCVTDCPAPAPCNCSHNQNCILISMSCDACPHNQCVPNPPSTSSSGSGVSTGALAGAIVGALVFLAVAAGFVWWYRRRLLRKRALARANEPKELPARAEDVLGRPDPNEKNEVVDQNNVRVYSSLSTSTINLDTVQYGQAIGSPVHSTHESTHSNPFEDSHSIQTTSTGTQGTNVIPIALVAPGSVPSMSQRSSSIPSSSNNPTRPGRTPELDLNLDHLNVSREGTPSDIPMSGAGSQVSNRNSYVSNMSYSSDFLNEVPMIVTPTRGTVRQVLGVVKAEVVQAPPSTPGTGSADSFKSTLTSKPVFRSPLAGSSFGPADVLKEAEEEHDTLVRHNPFADRGSPPVYSPQASPMVYSASAYTQTASPSSEWSLDEPSLPWARSSDKSRPTSLSTQAGSIIADIGSATRVQVGFRQLSPATTPTMLPAALDSPKTLHRMTSARLVSPPAPGSNSMFEQQQEKASNAMRRADHRVSGGSVLSTASTKADSILESFPFVPPSPISDRPARVAPRSPLAQQQFSNAEEKLSQPSSTLVNPPDRRTLGMSTGSQISTLSAGLGSFPFQIDTSSQDTSTANTTPASENGRQRASLDTLALTRDLSSYPLGFDKELHENYPLRK